MKHFFTLEMIHTMSTPYVFKMSFKTIPNAFTLLQRAEESIKKYIIIENLNQLTIRWVFSVYLAYLALLLCTLNLQSAYHQLY